MSSVFRSFNSCTIYSHTVISIICKYSYVTVNLVASSGKKLAIEVSFFIDIWGTNKLWEKETFIMSETMVLLMRKAFIKVKYLLEKVLHQ